MLNFAHCNMNIHPESHTNMLRLKKALKSLQTSLGGITVILIASKFYKLII